MRSIRWAHHLLFGIVVLLAVSGEGRTAAAGRDAMAPDTTIPPPDSIPYVESIQTFPARPVSDRPVVVAVIGRHPFPCGEVFLANARDAGHFVISIRPRASCADTTLTAWYEALLIGPLPPGTHHIELLLTVVQDPAAPPGSDPREYRGTFAFEVMDATPTLRSTWGALKRRYRR